MKPKVILEIPCDNTGGSCYMTFNKIEEIDDVMGTLEEIRADLDHQIEMEKQRKRDKRKRAKMRRKFEHENVSQEAVDAINERLKRLFDKQEDIAKSFVNPSENDDIHKIKFFDEEFKIDEDKLRKALFNGFTKELKEIDKIKMPKKEEIEEAFEEIKQKFDKIDDKDNFKKLLKPYMELAEALIKADK